MGTELGNAIRDYILKRRISISKLAEELGISKASLSDIIKGKVAEPRKAFYAKLADLPEIEYSYYELRAMDDPRLKAEIDAFLAHIPVAERRERLEQQRLFDQLPPEVAALVKAFVKNTK